MTRVVLKGCDHPLGATVRVSSDILLTGLAPLYA